MQRMLCWWASLLLLLAPPGVASAAERIVAIGDLHGDHQAWQAVARASGVMEPSGKWSGGRTVLIQTGDIVDRGPDSLRIIEELMRLQREARRAGGRVVVLNGNHEAMMVTNDLRYVHPGEYAAFVTPRSAALRKARFQQLRPLIEAQAQARDPQLSPAVIRDRWFAATPLGMIEHREAWSPTGRLGKWTIANPVVAKIGDSLFVHGGLSAEYSRLTLAAMNRQAASELSAATDSETALINDQLGPLWYRGLVTRAAEDDNGAPPAAAGTAPPPPPNPVQTPVRPTIEQELATVLAAYGAKRIVVGHTPSLRGIVIDHGGRLVRIDTGMSRHYNGPLSYLEILGDRLVPHTVPRPPAATGGKR